MFAVPPEARGHAAAAGGRRTVDPVTDAKAHLDLAARLACRAAGDVEPNPLVGAVLVKDGAIIGLGHHARFGGPHAERVAIEDARTRGHDPAGATMYVTLEPCAHDGKQPACVDAIVEAGLERVVCARRDPHREAAHGAERLREAGVGVDFTDASPSAVRLSDPFIKRETTGLPWVIAKWAQTIDGRVATREGRSRWISNERSRHRVHRLRARVDAIMSGIGTVSADDPELTARDVCRVRRVARRVVVDPSLRIPIASRLVRTIDQAPLTVVTSVAAANDDDRHEERRRLEAEGVQILALEPGPDGRLDPGAILRLLVRVHDVTNVLVEAGPGLLGAMHDERLIDELRVYVAPVLLGDAEAMPPLAGRAKPYLADGAAYELDRMRRVDDDVELRYLRRWGGSEPAA